MARARRAQDAVEARVVVRSFRAGDGVAASQVMVEAFRTFIPAAHQEIVFRGFAAESLEAASLPARGDRSSVAYVAAAGGRLLGYVRGSASYFGFGTLGVIGVSPDHLHEGVGSLLMRQMLRYWRRQGMRKVSTSVSAHNARAFQFYHKHGFRPVGYQRDHFMEGVDEVILDLFLARRRTGSGAR